MSGDATLGEELADELERVILAHERGSRDSSLVVAEKIIAMLPRVLAALRPTQPYRGEQSGDVRKSETPQGGVGNQKPREGSTPSAPSEMGLRPAEGHCLLQVPQQTPEKPSPCAMAGYCISAGQAVPSATRALADKLNEADADRFRFLVADPETGRHLLSLLQQGKGNEEALRKMIDRIKTSKEAARVSAE